MAQAHLERRDHVALLTLDRPERKNALNPALCDAIEARLDELEAALPRALVITGSGDDFCAGFDLNLDNPRAATFMQAVQNQDPDAARETLTPLRALFDRIATLPCPTIAAISGVAYGGGAELASRCDLRLADATARICFSEVKLGLMPDLGGGVALTRLLGPARAAEMILTARTFDADAALRIGFISRASKAGAVTDDALALGAEIAANGPRAVRASLHVIRRTPELSDEAALALELERAAALIATGECVHGVTAFMSRTPPEFPDA